MRITVKVGTSTLTHPSGHLNIRHVETLCKVLSDAKNAGHEIILVSSGAIGMGVGKLNLTCRPQDMPTKQAAAAVGQCELMYVYDKLFSEYNHTVAQILLTCATRRGTGILQTPCSACWSSGRCPSSMRTTALPPTRSASATTTPSARWLRSA